MKYLINLFGFQAEAKLSFMNGHMDILLRDEDQKALQAYLLRTIPRYGPEPSKDSTLEELAIKAIGIEKNLNGHMSEPRIKLPYEFQPEIKEKLIGAAELQDMSATQLLIRLIERKYLEVMGQGG